VDFSITFSEPVTGVTTDDFALTTTGALSGVSVAEIVGTGSEYIIAVNTGSGNGTLRLDVTDNDSIIDSAGNPLGGTGTGNGDFNTGPVYTVNKTAPSVTSSLRADPSPTPAENVNFTVNFSEAVTGVDTGDFALSTSGNLTGAYVASVSGAGSIYTVTVGTGTGDGGLRLDILDNDSILNTASVPLGGAGTGNGNFTTGESYLVDKTVPSVSASLRADANPTTADVVSFTVVFTEAVSGVDGSDFFLSTSGTLSGASITGLSGSGYTYTVTAVTGSGEGTLRLEVLDNDSIVDAVGHPLGGAGLGNGNFTTGEEYTVNKIVVKKVIETFRSNGKNDGWVLESSEDSNQGGSKSSNSVVFALGDSAQNQQFRAILHFPTYYLPNNAVITRVLLMLRREALVGDDPFTTHQNIQVDIRSGAFGFIGPFQFRGLQVSDFQSPSSMDAVGYIQNNPFNSWYWAWLDSTAFQYINRYGTTQIRLGFQVDDDNDFSNDYLRFYSGDYNELAHRPRLVVEYYVP
jgi:hypothetical protein